MAMHQAYRHKLMELKKRYEQEASSKILFEVTNFLNEWWTWHINHADKDYSECFNQHGLF